MATITRTETIEQILGIQNIMEHLSVIKQIDGGLLKNGLEY